MWLAKQTLPDIAFDIPMIASKFKISTIEDFKRVNKLLRKVRNDTVSFYFKELGEHVELLLYTDASFCNLSDGGSQGGFVIMLLGENEKINPVTWQSKTRCVKATWMVPSQKFEKFVISITHVDTNMMVLSHIENQLKIWRCI